jgi:hypothetical protein
MVKSKRLTVKNFRAWLKSKQPEDFVGRIASCGSCPIAEFFRANTPKFTRVWVSDDRIAIYTTKKRWLNTPAWAAGFIYAVDKLPPPFTVSAEQALEVLDQVTGETNVLCAS